MGGGASAGHSSGAIGVAPADLQLLRDVGAGCAALELFHSQVNPSLPYGQLINDLAEKARRLAKRLSQLNAETSGRPHEMAIPDQVTAQMKEGSEESQQIGP